MRLKSMLKSLDLTCKKSYYPHFFNTASNLIYVGPYPEPEFYGAESMSVGERAQFLESYEEQKCKLFSNKDKPLAYYIYDVKVLRQAFCAFKNLFLKLVNMDPFREANTISSILNMVYQTLFLKPDTVGIIARAGYRMDNRQSTEVLQWLAYMGRTRKIIYAVNGRVIHLPVILNVKFDGYCQ
jgi:hypothetical protein